MDVNYFELGVDCGGSKQFVSICSCVTCMRCMTCCSHLGPGRELLRKLPQPQALLRRKSQDSPCTLLGLAAVQTHRNHNANDNEKGQAWVTTTACKCCSAGSGFASRLKSLQSPRFLPWNQHCGSKDTDDQSQVWLALLSLTWPSFQ